MKTLCRSIASWLGVACLALTSTVFVALGTTTVVAQTTPYALFQNSTLTSTTNTIDVTLLPVVTSSGISYVNLVVEFSVAADGTITVAPGYPQQTPAPTPLVLGFDAGNYFGGGAQSGYGVTVSGPAVARGANTEWSLSETSGANANTFPSNAVWYVVGNIKNNPLYSRIVAAKINTNGWDAFGVVGSNNCYGGFCNAHWSTNTLLGFAQTGVQLSISSFTTTAGSTQTDYSTPVDNISYCKNKACGQ